jgi:hypothetical protein
MQPYHKDIGLDLTVQRSSALMAVLAMDWTVQSDYTDGRRRVTERRLREGTGMPLLVVDAPPRARTSVQAQASC